MCEPVSIGTAVTGLLTAAAPAAGAAAVGAVAARSLMGSDGGGGGSTPSAPSTPTAAPTKTDADIQADVEEERRRLSLSTLGFGANFQDKLGSMGAFVQAPVSRLTLG